MIKNRSSLPVFGIFAIAFITAVWFQNCGNVNLLDPVKNEAASIPEPLPVPIPLPLPLPDPTPTPLPAPAPSPVSTQPAANPILDTNQKWVDYWQARRYNGWTRPRVGGSIPPASVLQKCSRFSDVFYYEMPWYQGAPLAAGQSNSMQQVEPVFTGLKMNSVVVIHTVVPADSYTNYTNLISFGYTEAPWAVVDAHLTKVSTEPCDFDYVTPQDAGNADQQAHAILPNPPASHDFYNRSYARGVHLYYSVTIPSSGYPNNRQDTTYCDPPQPTEAFPNPDQTLGRCDLILQVRYINQK